MTRPASDSGGLADRPHLVLLLGLLAIAVTANAARGEDRAGSLARYFPARGMTSYVEYDGLDAHAEAWKGTAAYDVLGRTPAGATMTDVARWTLDRLVTIGSSDARPSGSDLVACQERLTHHGFASASYADGGRTWRIAVFRRLGGSADRDRVDRLLRFWLDVKEGNPISNPFDLRGRKVNEPPTKADAGDSLLPKSVRPGPTWWLEGETLVYVQAPQEDLLSRAEDHEVPEPNFADLTLPKIDDVPDAPMENAPREHPKFPAKQDEDSKPNLADLHKANINGVLDALEGKTLNASTNPGVIAARAEGRDIPGFEPNGLFFSEPVKGQVLDDQLSAVLESLRSRPDGRDLMKMSGLDGTRRILCRWGFRGKALLTDVRFETDGPWKGLIGILEPAGVSKFPLPPVARGAGAAGLVALRHVLDEESRAIGWSFLSLKPSAVPFVLAAKRVFEDAGNRPVLSDLFKYLGPAWCICADPGAVAIEVKDAAVVEAKLNKAAVRLNAYFREQDFGKTGEANTGDAPVALVLERLPAPDRGYRLVSPDDRVPWLSDVIQPTILLHKSFAVLALNPDIARKAVSVGEMKPSGEMAKALECLPGRPAIVLIGNPRDSAWPEAMAKLRKGVALFLEAMADAGTDLAPTDVLSTLRVRPLRTESLKADDLRTLIFPSVLSATLDEKSFRLVSLEALPFGCLGMELDTEGEGSKRTFKAGVYFKTGK